MDACFDLSSLLNDITSTIILHDSPIDIDNLISMSYIDIDRTGYSIYSFGQEGKALEPLFIRVMCKNQSVSVVFDWINLVQIKLDGLYNTVINNHEYILIGQVDNVKIVGKDLKGNFAAYVDFKILVNG